MLVSTWGFVVILAMTSASNPYDPAGSDYPRDMGGYGRNPPDPGWPGGARIALNIVVNYEEGGESNVLHGDPASVAFLTEHITTPRVGERNLTADSLWEFGSRVGFWRLWRVVGSSWLRRACKGTLERWRRRPPWGGRRP